MKNIFFFFFIFTFLIFIILFTFYHENYLYEIFLHCSFLSAAFYLLWKKEDNLRLLMKKLGIPPENIKKTILFSIAGFAGVIVIMIVLLLVLSAFNMADNEKVLSTLKKVPFWILPFAVFVAPFTEELLFRAALVPRLGVVGSSIIFGLLHIFYGSIMEIVGTIAIGMLLAIVYKESKSILAPIFIHFCFNLLTVLALLYNG